jgi:hypothetical protein
MVGAMSGTDDAHRSDTGATDDEDPTPGRPEDVGQLLGACLRAVGATRVFGASSDGITGIPGLGHLRVDEPALASLLADAAGRIGGGPGVALLPGRRLRLSSAPGLRVAAPTVVADVTELPAAVASWTWGEVHAATELVLDVDLDAPVPEGVDPLVVDPTAGARAPVLSPDLAGTPLAVLAGPGVVRAGAVDALAAFARKVGAVVVNTWGAKGVFAWDDPHHGGTVGLQAGDLELAGIASAPLVLAVGLDAAELPGGGPLEALVDGQVLHVEPWHLESLTWRWPEGDAPAPTERPALYAELSAVIGPAYEDDAVPLHPARAVRDLSVAARGALVAADPGPAGFWVARAFPTPTTGAVVVPGTPAEGFAVAAGMVAGLDQRRSLAVVDGPMGGVTRALVELASVVGSPVVVCEWGSEGRLPDARAHRVALREGLAAAGPTHVQVPVAVDDRDALEAVAGPVVAWGGPSSWSA